MCLSVLLGFIVTCPVLLRGSHLFPSSQVPLPVNSNLFAVNDVLGPIFPIPYNSSVLESIACSLRLGGMRFPGGTVANYWNITSGRYVRGCNVSSCTTYGPRIDNFPLGTFTLSNFLQGMGKDLTASVPLIDLNCLTLTETEALAQLDWLEICKSRECLIELSNELYLNSGDYVSRFPTATQYLSFIEPVVKEIRARYPMAKISLPASNIPTVLALAKGQKPSGRSGSWLVDLAKRRDLFDGITVHDYSLQDYYFKRLPKEVWPTLMAAFPEGVYQNITKYLKAEFGENIEIWISEYNVGLKSSSTSYLREVANGGMHGLFTISHIFSAISNEATIKVMFYHALLSVNGTAWDSNSGMVRLSSLQSQSAYINGVSQLFAHVNAVARNSSTMSSVEHSGEKIPFTDVPFMANLTCLQAAVFFSESRGSNDGQMTYIVINRCPKSLETSFDVNHSVAVDRQAILVSYICSTDEPGRWVPMPNPEVPFPWPEPVPSETSKQSVAASKKHVQFNLPMFSLNVMTLTW